MHPFAKARERTRALNAAKLDKIFSKPFVDSLEGHIDAVEVLAKPLESLTTVASGSWDGGEPNPMLKICKSVTRDAEERSSC
jgi:WD repeat and SOF domain-containing protein 1